MTAKKTRHKPKAASRKADVKTNVDPAEVLAGDIGRSKTVLLVGRPSSSLAERLHAADCGQIAIVFDEASADAARAYCSLVEIVDPDAWTLPETVSALRFDAVVFDGALELVAQPTLVLTDVGKLVNDRGFVAATVSHTAHGAIRLALIQDALSEPYLGVASSHEATKMFQRSGYSVKDVRRVLLPVFGQTGDLPSVSRSDFPAAVVRQVEDDFEAETVKFLITAVLPASESGSPSEDPQPEHFDEREDEYVVQFETEFEAQRRQTQLERELQAAREELDRERGRVIALEAQFSEEIAGLTSRLAETNAALESALGNASRAESELSADEPAQASVDET